MDPLRESLDAALSDPGPDAAAVVAATTSGQLSATEVVQRSLDRIRVLDPLVNAFSVVLAEQALARATALDELHRDGRPHGPLHGVPVAVKDEIAVAGCVTTFGGRGNSTPATRDGEVVRRLRDAGAVVVGTTRMPEFGQWPFTESVDGGLTRNPWDTERTPGGSSGGSAVAVATGMVPVALGGDGGGSIRIPAACCGIFGLKPTRGRVTADPMPHLWWALGTTGPLTRTVHDSALVYDVIRGNLAADRFTCPEPATSFSQAADTAPGRLRVGWWTAPVTKGLRPDPQHVRAVEDTAARLAALDHEVARIDPHYPDPTLAFVPQFLGGVRAEADLVEHRDRLEPRTRSLLRLGTWAREPVVERAMRAGDRIAERVDRVFDDVDVLLTPALLSRPPAVGRLADGGPLRAAARSMPMIAYTALWNVTGNPACSVPVGTGTDGLPLAVQLVGRPGDEPTLLSLAAQLIGR
jgi:amidase